jgi:hypothetical protein
MEGIPLGAEWRTAGAIKGPESLRHNLHGSLRGGGCGKVAVERWLWKGGCGKVAVERWAAQPGDRPVREMLRPPQRKGRVIYEARGPLTRG